VKRGLSSSVSVALAISVVFSPHASSVYKGESASGDVKVLTLASSKGVRTQFCSMAMLTERIVVTAGHCMAAEASSGGKLRFDTEQIWVTQPGAEMLVDEIGTRVKVAKVVLVPGYENYWDPAKRDRRTQRDDIAFIFLDQPLKSGYTIPIASASEVSQLKASGGLITHFGYGLQEENKINHSPYKLSLRALTDVDSYLDANKTIFTREDGRALCPGDSGGPWYADFNGVTKILAVTVAAGGCRGNLDPRGATLGTLIYPYLELMKIEWEKFLLEEASLKRSREEAAAAKMKAEEESKKLIESARANGTYIQDNSGCHARGVQAILQFKSTAGWTDIRAINGWADNPGCPSTHPVQPWNIIEREPSLELRWRIWSPGAWEAFSQPFFHVPIPRVAPTPSASPSSTPSPSPSASPSSTPSQLISTPSPKPKATITCVKGKTKKKIIGVKPKCPSGYRIQK
jgi:hypothetical protein